MELDIAKLANIYGTSIIHDINDEIENLVPNIRYMKSIGFTNVEDIIELYPFLFIKDNVEFTEKVEQLINKVGSDYIEVLNTNTELWGYIDE